MRLGIDFGTTRTIVSRADRGNYPVVSFTEPSGDTGEYFPSVVALEDGQLVYGFHALDAAKRGAPLRRSFKRILSEPAATALTPVSIGVHEFPILDVITGFLQALRTALLTASNVADAFQDEEMSCVVAVPANAHGAQRLLTLDAFHRAGFDVAALLNEPSAAGFEYSHRQKRTLNSRRTRVIVYDLGGGTFDASLVNVEGTSHDVVGSTGINALGGDDFDVVLAQLACELAGKSIESLDDHEHQALLDDARIAKEQLSPQSKRIPLEVAGDPVTVLVADFYDAAAPLAHRTITSMAPLMERLDISGLAAADVAGIYLVGGASSLPLIPRSLREKFGHRVHRSPYPAASTAIGLAIAADDASGFSLNDRLWRGFGVFRERDSGHAFEFDPIFTRDTPLPLEGTLEITRTYQARHNIGEYRFLEFTSLDEFGVPRSELTPWTRMLFPFEDRLTDAAELAEVPVERTESGPHVEERYRIDPNGLVDVTITNLSSGFAQQVRLGR